MIKPIEPLSYKDAVTRSSNDQNTTLPDNQPVKEDPSGNCTNSTGVTPPSSGNCTITTDANGKTTYTFKKISTHTYGNNIVKSCVNSMFVRVTMEGKSLIMRNLFDENRDGTASICADFAELNFRTRENVTLEPIDKETASELYPEIPLVKTGSYLFNVVKHHFLPYCPGFLYVDIPNLEKIDPSCKDGGMLTSTTQFEYSSLSIKSENKKHRLFELNECVKHTNATPKTMRPQCNHIVGLPTDLFVPEDYAVFGMKDKADYINRNVVLPLIAPPDIIETLGIRRMNKGVLLYGEPGTGKSHFAKNFARFIAKYVMFIRGPELDNCYIGETQHRVREIFEEAKTNPTEMHCVVIDEVESLFGDRKTSREYRAGVTMQFMTMLDDDSITNLFFVLTTNYKDRLDDALVRDGRIGFELEFGLPDEAARRAIVQSEVDKMSPSLFGDADDKDTVERVVEYVVENTGGKTVATIAGLFEKVRGDLLHIHREKGELPPITTHMFDNHLKSDDDDWDAITVNDKEQASTMISSLNKERRLFIGASNSDEMRNKFVLALAVAERFAGRQNVRAIDEFVNCSMVVDSAFKSSDTSKIAVVIHRFSLMAPAIQLQVRRRMLAHTLQEMMVISVDTECDDPHNYHRCYSSQPQSSLYC